ncbi:MAG: 4Fe-4S dicluster domain-containing protein [Planctomycetes bacterium]|nr:4Fe-4S dicluster domain-containing protein [Planctomycetota bacterium]
MVSLKIDGRETQAEPGTTVLEAARSLGISIPTLCHHEGLPPYGACRICVVEVSAGGRIRIESSCTRPVEEGIEVWTDTEKIRGYRTLIAELLLARCPDSERVQEVARDVGVTETRFEKKEEECILCGLCVRACQDAMGTSAISFVNRGYARKVDTPFSINSETCAGCGACAKVCPTGAIQIEDVNGKRIIRYFHTELELEQCPECGARFVSKKFQEKTDADQKASEELRHLCPDCRRKRASRSLREHMVY